MLFSPESSRSDSMKNALLPSHLYNFACLSGNSDFQMSNWDAQMNMNRKIGGFCIGSKTVEIDNHSRVAAGDFSLPLDDQSSLFTFQPDYSNLAFGYDHGISRQQPMLLEKHLSAPQLEDFQVIDNARKRPIIEASDDIKSGLGCFDGERIASNEWNKRKRGKVTNSQQQWHTQLQEASREETQVKRAFDWQQLQVPVRKSQKLSDKITTLQKLVSPYGKTDTASVLHEASICITHLHEQIQYFYRMLGSSYKNATSLHSQEIGSSSQVSFDLRSRGLCLVPISITQKVNMEEGGDDDHHFSTSRKFVIANNF